MKIVYYSFTPVLDTFLPKVAALSKLVDLVAFVEMTPWSWNKSFFDVPRMNIPSGIVDAEILMSGANQEMTEAYSSLLKRIKLVSYTHPKSLHPANWKSAYTGAKAMTGCRPDVLHFDGASLIFAPGLPFLDSIPMIMDVHDGRLHKGEGNWRTDLARYLHFKRSARFITHSEWSRNELSASAKLPIDKISTIRLGPLDIFRNLAKSDTPVCQNTVLFFGRISHYKGLDTLIEAASLVGRKIPDLRIIIAGRPVFGYALPSTLKNLDSVHIEVIDRYITNVELARLFQRATVVVCPYLEATQSGVILTAYAFGKPVIATNVGGLPEYVWDGETGRLVPPNDPATLAAAIVDVLRDPGMNSGIEAALARRSDELSWDSWASKVVEVYDQVLAGGNVRGAR